jgi:hypothetical protein
MNVKLKKVQQNDILVEEGNEMGFGVTVGERAVLSVVRIQKAYTVQLTGSVQVMVRRTREGGR